MVIRGRAFAYSAEREKIRVNICLLTAHLPREPLLCFRNILVFDPFKKALSGLFLNFGFLLVQQTMLLFICPSSFSGASGNSGMAAYSTIRSPLFMPFFIIQKHLLINIQLQEIRKNKDALGHLLSLISHVAFFMEPPTWIDAMVGWF